MKPSATSAGRGKMPSVISRRPSAASKPSGCGTISALRAGPPGARPTCAGSARSSVPPRLSKSSSKNMSERSPNTPNASSVSNKHSTSRSNLALPPCGRGPPGLARRPVHRGGHHRGRTGRPDALREPPTAHEMLGPDPLGIFQWRATPAGSASPRLAIPMPVGPWSKAPGPTGIRPKSVGTSNCAWKAPQAIQDISWKAQVRLCTTLSTPDGPRQTCQPGRGGHCPGTGWLHVGHCQAGSCDPLRRIDGRRCAPHVSRLATVHRKRRSPGLVSPSTA